MEEDHRTENAWRLLLLCQCVLVLLTLAACTKKKTSEQESGHPTPIPVVPRKNYDTARLYNGVSLKSSIEVTNSQLTALEAATNGESYQLDLTLRIDWPKPAVKMSDLLLSSPDLPELLPDLETQLQGTSASPDFATLLKNKERFLKAGLISLQKLPSRDNLFDCQTILNLRGKQTGRPALLVAAQMNVNTDGSDGDRNLEVEKLSSFYQPQTNYRWPKKGDRPNPCLKDAEERATRIGSELSAPNLALGDRTRLEAELETVKATVIELKRWSFLVGGADPFIVLPSFMVGKSPGQPNIGDYAVVIYHGTLYPAILGDLGPNSKIGETSLRICREIDSRSGADRRPASKPEVLYFIFPGSADKPSATPDYGHWSERCRSLWKKFGGSDSASWHDWSNLEKPWPTPLPERAAPDGHNTTPLDGTNPAAPTLASPAEAVKSTSSLSSPEPKL
jgi:hypothetical protein